MTNKYTDMHNKRPIRDERPIILAGASSSGKSTAAAIIREITGYKIYSVREHYNKFLVPRYFKKNNSLDKKITRDLHHKIANEIYAKGKYTYAKMFLRDMRPITNSIFESFRLKEDLEYMHKVYPDALFIHVYAQEEVRLKRKVAIKDTLYSNAKNFEDIRKSLKYEWEHYKLQESMDYLESIGAVMIDTTDFSGNNKKLYEILSTLLK